jgi:holliday junction DNA helicase RuvA
MLSRTGKTEKKDKNQNMIATVNGTLTKKKPDCVVVDVNGIGILMEIPLSTFYSLPEQGKTVFLHTHTLVREDAIRLFGFLSESEMAMFKILIDVNRIGPKLALTILSGVSPSDLHTAVIKKDSAVLSAIPGIGKKSADRILFEIGDKLDKIGAVRDRTETGDSMRLDEKANEIVMIMLNLGYKQKDAERAVELVVSELEEEKPVDEMIRLALKKLAGR